MASQPFEKVNVCEICGVSRKTFYYHFKDKYDLAEWIFNTGFTSMLQTAEREDRWLFAGAICRCFYQERDFYSALLKFEGQNSFRDYFQRFMFRALEPFIRPDEGELPTVTPENGIAPDRVRDFYSHFATDAMLLSIFRWVTEGSHIPPDQFVSLLRGAAELLCVQTEKDMRSRKKNEARTL